MVPSEWGSLIVSILRVLSLCSRRNRASALAFVPSLPVFLSRFSSPFRSRCQTSQSQNPCPYRRPGEDLTKSKTMWQIHLLKLIKILLVVLMHGRSAGNTVTQQTCGVWFNRVLLVPSQTLQQNICAKKSNIDSMMYQFSFFLPPSASSLAHPPY